MPEFDTSHVKNIVLLGHAGSGKTTLTESMLFEAGLTNSRGNVLEQNTISDYHELEQERGNSIFSTLLHTKWRGYKINIIDTPGYDDFSGEVISALRIADAGVLLLNATSGVEVGADLIWQYTEQFKTPMIFAVNKLDDDTADFDITVQEAKSHFGNKIVVIQYPRQQGAGFHEIIDVLRMTMYKFKDTGGKPEKLPIPEEEKQKAQTILTTTQQKMAEVEMQALRAQMNPHFIFNCLNSIQQYILTNEREKASQYLTGFASLIAGLLLCLQLL